MSELPTGWADAKFGELGEIRLGKMLDKAKNRGVPVQYLRNINVRWFRFDISDLQTLLLPAEERDALTIRDGDLLICEGGEPGVGLVNVEATAYQQQGRRVRCGNRRDRVTHRNARAPRAPEQSTPVRPAPGQCGMRAAGNAGAPARRRVFLATRTDYRPAPARPPEHPPT